MRWRPELTGAYALPLQAIPDQGAALYPGGSVPGSVHEVPGGVSFNIARSLALLGLGSGCAPPQLISAVGDDSRGLALLHYLRRCCLSDATVAVIPGGRTPTVSIIFSESGDVAASVADVGLLEAAVTPEYLQAHGTSLSHARYVVVDGDLSQKSVEVSLSHRIIAGLLVPCGRGLFFFTLLSCVEPADCVHVSKERRRSCVVRACVCSKSSARCQDIVALRFCVAQPNGTGGNGSCCAGRKPEGT